jgi:hypothetical protein
MALSALVKGAFEAMLGKDDQKKKRHGKQSK